MGVEGDAKLDRKQKSKDEAKARASADGWKGFINVELTDQQKPEVKELMRDMQSVWDEVIDLIAADYKLTVSFDGERSAWNASLTCRSTADRNGGLTLTGRGGSFVAALAALVYKHVRILNRDWSSALQQVAMHWDVDDVR